MAYDLGDVVTLGIQIKDAFQALADATAVVVTITAPDATTPTPTIIHPSTGIYTVTFTPTVPGRHKVRWVATGTNANVYTDVVDVWPADPRFIISLDDARAALNVSSTSRVNDAELLLYIAATTEVIEDIVGNVLTTTITETFDGGGRSILLAQVPSAITSVTVNGTATTNYVANLSSGIIHAGSTTTPWIFQEGIQNVVVTYAAGLQQIPPNIILAAREEVRFLYQIGQQAGRPAFNTDLAPQDMSWTPSGFAVPQRVIELCNASLNRALPNF